MTRPPVTPDDLIAAGVAARDALAQLGENQWMENPPNMEWTRFITASHICGATQFYATQLAIGSPTYTATIRLDEAATKAEDWPELVRSQATVLAMVARGVPAETRAWHGTGNPDIEGFLAMGSAEVLLHCWDTVQGTDIRFVGDEAISDHILQRLFPWQPTDTPRWQTLLFATGRAELEGYESPGEEWMWHNAPLDEWEGNEKRSDVWVKKK